MFRRSLVSRGVAGLLLVVALFQCALVLGAPWGALAWGGGHRGALPLGLRAASAVSLIVYAALMGVALRPQRLGRAQRVVCSIFAALFALGALANAVSPSPVERVWAPVAALLSVGFFVLRSDVPERSR